MDAIAVSSTVALWVNHIDTYDRQFQKWEKRSKKIIKRYKDDREQLAVGARFNILWSNVQTLAPALYASPPKPNVDRRYTTDKDDLGRYAALVLERAVSYYAGHQIFDDTMKQVVLDRLLSGRGTTWVRYVPVFQDAPQLSDDSTMGADDAAQVEPEQVLYDEDVVPDYVHWQDFGHVWGRTWQEVPGVWRRVYLSRSELIKRFGEEKGKLVPLDAKPPGEKEDPAVDRAKKAIVYEIWDKTNKKVIWIHKDMPDVLDERDDPLGLKDFFPCPKPLYATLTNDDLVPTPDFMLYQDQANELDALTARIASIVKSIKVAGVYDASAQGLDRLLSEGVENKLIGVQQWAVLGDKGLKGAISFLPMEEIIRTVLALYEAREATKQVIYEITGISDIVRGATKANETATAQQIKGQFATLRLDDQQKDVARFACDIVRIMTEIIAEHFSMDTIKQVSGIKLLTEQEKQQIKMMQQMATQQPQPGMPPAPPMPPIPEEALELMDMPSWEQVEQLIRNDAARCFRIDIETDSTIKTDQEAEKQARIEFLGAAGSFIQQAVQVPNPELQPLLMEMLMFGVRGFKVSRELETAFENTIAKMKKVAENPPPEQPDPEQMKAQAEMQRTQAQMEIQAAKNQGEMQKIQAQAQADQTQAGLEAQKMQIEGQLKLLDIELKKLDLQLKAASIQEKEAQVNNGNVS